MNAELRVLLVDDERDLVNYLAKRLTARGFAVTGTTSGEQALAAARDLDIDVAVVDLRMPGMNGEEVAARLKTIQPSLKIVILTGHGTVESALACRKRGVFRYLAKPHDFDALVQIIREAGDIRRDQLRE